MPPPPTVYGYLRKRRRLASLPTSSCTMARPLLEVRDVSARTVTVGQVVLDVGNFLRRPEADRGLVELRNQVRFLSYKRQQPARDGQEEHLLVGIIGVAGKGGSLDLLPRAR